MLLEVLLGCLLVLLSVLFIWIYRKQRVFSERGIPHVTPLFIFGHSLEVWLGRRHESEVMGELYERFPEADLFGYMDLWTPQIVLRNPDWIEAVLIKEFASFHDRVKTDGRIRNSQDANLFVIGGNSWRAIRFKFSPLFTSGKLKLMYETMKECGHNLCSVLEGRLGAEVEMSDVMGLFAMDVIGSTVFGIEPTLLKNPESEFREKAKKLLQGGVLANIRILLLFFAPKLAELLNIKGFVDEDLNKYFTDMISDTIKFRKEKGFTRNDFVQMLLALKEKGKIEMQITDPSDDYLIMDKSNETFELELTDDLLVGGAFTFLFAGFHATAMTLTYALFELAQKPQVLDKLRQEIKASVKGDVPTYEELKYMTYCDKIIKETARKHPTAHALGRVCNREHTFPGGGVTLRPGDFVAVPVQALHMDPLLWPDPEEFSPERFDVEPRPGTYLPFGEGPRICIAMRFAMMEMKLALVILVSRYNFELSSSTQLPLRSKPRDFLKTPRGGITFRLTKREEPQV